MSEWRLCFYGQEVCEICDGCYRITDSRDPEETACQVFSWGDSPVMWFFCVEHRPSEYVVLTQAPQGP